MVETSHGAHEENSDIQDKCIDILRGILQELELVERYVIALTEDGFRVVLKNDSSLESTPYLGPGILRVDFFNDGSTHVQPLRLDDPSCLRIYSQYLRLIKDRLGLSISRR